MDIFVGIDPSINSTGICILKENKEKFFIITPEITKKAFKLADKILNFNYIIYDKVDLSIYKDDNHLHERFKSLNMVNLINNIYNTITSEIPINEMLISKIHIVIEGISYGSTKRTKSIFDLAGLNYMIRYKFLKKDNIDLTIVPPSEIKKFATGNGNCNKTAMETLFMATHENFNLPKVDDIADAYFMAKYSIKIFNDINGNNNK